MARVDEAQGRRLSAFGDCIGLAFQIHDDILDVTGDSGQIGKSTHADAALNKPTFPSILGLNASKQRAQELTDQALAHLESINGDTSALSWLAQYVIRRDR
jgi:geranylgeranyl pyrophosphate synthase